MSTFELAEAGTRLPELVERARRGEGVVITHEGAPVAELRPLATPAHTPHPVTEEDIAWLRARRITPAVPFDAGAEISRMRDEDWH